jgi:hypothetical protein
MCFGMVGWWFLLRPLRFVFGLVQVRVKQTGKEQQAKARNCGA